jgi:hypothetical protein
MFTEVQQHVHQRLAHLLWAVQRPAVIAVGPHAPAPSCTAIDRAGATDRQSLQAAAERDVVVRLDDEVQVIGLHRELDQAKPPPAASRERVADGGKHSFGSQ